MESSLDPLLLKKYAAQYSSSEATIAEIKKAFDIIDTNNNGSIQPYEFQAILEELGLIDESGISTKNLINELDLNKNGYVDFEEFLAFALKKVDEHAEKEEIDKLFAYYDEENKGKISLQDLERVANILGQRVEPAELRKMFGTLDFDADGLVEKQDFYNMMAGKISFD